MSNFSWVQFNADSNSTSWVLWDLERFTPDSAPGNFSASWTSSTDSVGLSWDTTPSTDSYLIGRKWEHEGVRQQIAAVDDPTNFYSDNTVSEISTGRWDVASENGFGIGPRSFSTTTVGLFPPSDVTASELSATAALVSWTDNSSKESSYNIRRWDFTSGTTSSQTTVAANSSNWTDSTITSSNTYQWTVRSVAEAF